MYEDDRPAIATTRGESERLEPPKRINEWDEADKILDKAKEVAAYYKSIGINACDLPQIHRVLRAIFGY